MDLVISSLIGAIAAVLAAYITSKVNDKKKEQLIKELQSRFQIENKNVYIINTKKMLYIISNMNLGALRVAHPSF